MSNLDQISKQVDWRGTPAPGGGLRVDMIKRKYGDDILKLRGVGAIGVGTGTDRSGSIDAGYKQIGLVIYTRSSQDKDRLDNLLEDRIEGVPVYFEVTGDIV